MSKVSKIDQIHLRAVMLCMSKTSKMYIKGVLRYINTRDQSNVKGVEDIKTSHNRFDLSSMSSTYIALQPLGVFDLSSTSSTCFDIHRI